MPLSFFSKVSKRFRNRHFVILDLFIVLFSPFLALLIRFEGNVELWGYIPEYFYLVVLAAIIKMIVYFYFGLYSQLWAFASVDELAKLIFAGLVSTLLEITFFQIPFIMSSPVLQKFPLSLPLLDGGIAIFFVALSRFSVRLFERANQKFNSRKISKNIGIVGAGQGGIMICQELFRHADKGRIVVFVDDDKTKQNLKILGVPVEGPIDRLSEIIALYRLEKVIVAMPSAPGVLVRRVSDECIAAGIEVLTAPAMNEIIDGKITFHQLRKVQVEDLLRREPIKTDVDKVQNYIENKRILVTGAGGSIGSELCRQIMNFKPSTLILLGHGENSVFDIEQELRYKLGSKYRNIVTSIICKITDIRFKDNLARVFQETEPQIVFHAAAHKHVPLMENNPAEAITNNVLGTKNLIELSAEYNVEDFILISTDKAVNPSSIMGTTKRIAEMLTLSAARKHNKRFSAVRFGNVLGSRGSVLQTFKKQALSGGPITITDSEIRRFFMTIPEAVQLVLQSSVLSNGGEVFILDMGEPVKIIDLAKDFVRLSGLKEGVDINIEVTGLRPGEKLFEELFIKGEKYIQTEHDKIMIASNASSFVWDDIEDKVDQLISETKLIDMEKLFYLLKAIVPEYTPSADSNFIKIGQNNGKS